MLIPDKRDAVFLENLSCSVYLTVETPECVCVPKIPSCTLIFVRRKRMTYCNGNNKTEDRIHLKLYLFSLARGGFVQCSVLSVSVNLLCCSVGSESRMCRMWPLTLSVFLVFKALVFMQSPF